MAARSNLTRNILSNWTGFFVQIVTTFFLTPVILSSLGPTAYGVWALAIGLTGYYGLLDLGVRAALTQFIARHLATRNHERMNQTASTGFALLTGVSAVLSVVALGVSLLAPHVLTLPEGPIRRDAQVAIAVLGLGVASQFAFFIFSAVLTATERFDVANAVGIASRILIALASYAVLAAKGGLVGLAFVTAIGSLVDYGARSVLAYRVLPDLRLRARYVSIASAREFLGFGLWNAAIAGGTRLISYSDALVIAAFLPTAAVTPFAVAVNLSSYFTEIVASANVVFFPRFTRLDAEGNRDAMRRLYLRGSSVLAALSVVGGTAACMWADTFLRLWLGPSVLNANPFGSAAALFRILMIGAIATGATRIGYQVMFGTRRVKTLAGLMLCEGIVNLALSVALVRRMGLAGVAIGTAVPAVFFNTLIHPWVVCRQLDIRLGEYFRAVYPRAFLAGACSVMVIWWLGLWPVVGWPGLAAQVSLGLLLCAAIVVLLWHDAVAELGLFPRAIERVLSRAFGGHSQKYEPVKTEPNSF